MPLIDVEKITKTYTRDDVPTHALRGVSLRIEAGECVAIMGPSGSGKSTLLHIIGFLDRPTSGEYRFDGLAMDSYSENELARVRNQKIGFVFQAFNLQTRTTVLDNVILPLLYNPEARHQHQRTEQARAALEQVGMSHRLLHTPSQLSGGEKQRVAIARALVNKPKLILADEPTGNLDVATGHAVMEILATLNARGHTVVLITHETPTAQYAQRIIRVQDGLIVSDKPAAPSAGHYHK